ncbi:phage protein NinX family protein [Serratia fonticola]
MNYSELSDFEINVRVASYHGLGQVFLVKNGGRDYCGNIAHIWPIILEKKICIMPLAWGGWRAMWEHGQADNCNPLRAAAIVYLMMQEQQHDR